MNTQEFAQTIKAKYPQYKGVDDATLVSKIVEKYPIYKSQVSDISTDTIEQPQQSFTERVGTSIVNRAKEATKLSSESMDANTPFIIGVGKQFQAGGQYAGIIGDVANEAIKSVDQSALGRTLSEQNKPDIKVQEALSDPNSFASKTTKFKDELYGKLSSAITKISSTHPEVAKDLEALSNYIGAATTAAGITQVPAAASEATTSLKDTLGKLNNIEDTIVSRVGNTGISKQKVAEVLSNDPDARTVTILKETPTKKFDQYLAVAKQAAEDPRKLTPFEVVGDKMSVATKQLKELKDAAGKAKSDYVASLRHGMDKFDAKPYTDKLVSLKNATSIEADRNLIDKVINKVSDVKTVQSADRLVDDVQEIIYRGNKDLTIPSGSSVDKQLRSIIGEINNKLKSQLPPGYGKLNTEFARLTKVTNSLNKALGEVVEGVPTRGAGLIKQFFSPSGRKAKELFQYIAQKTGIDLAQDATLARFTMELYNDARAKSLLDGLPTSKSGILNKAIDFAVEKTGLGEGLQNASREGSAGRARGFTKQN